MTRQWLANPEWMCTRHLSGEHLEAHIFLTKMQHGHSLEGFRRGSMFFGARFIEERHDVLANQLPGHQTPLIMPPNLYDLYPYEEPTVEDYNKSLSDLLGRCKTCRDGHDVIEGMFK